MPAICHTHTNPNQTVRAVTGNNLVHILTARSVKLNMSFNAFVLSYFHTVICFLTFANRNTHLP